MLRELALSWIAVLVVTGWIAPVAAIPAVPAAPAAHADAGTTTETVRLQNVTVNTLELANVTVDNVLIEELVVRNLTIENETRAQAMNRTDDEPLVLQNVTLTRLEITGLSVEEITATGTGNLTVGPPPDDAEEPDGNETRPDDADNETEPAVEEPADTDGEAAVANVTFETLTVGSLTVENMTVRTDRTEDAGILSAFIDFITGLLGGGDDAQDAGNETAANETEPEAVDGRAGPDDEQADTHLVIEDASVDALVIETMVVDVLEAQEPPPDAGNETAGMAGQAQNETVTVIENVTVERATIDRLETSTLSFGSGNRTDGFQLEGDDGEATPTPGETETPTETETETPPA